MADFPPWVWDIPERFNIGVACTDAHLGTPVTARAAVIVDGDAGGVRQATFAELAGRRRAVSPSCCASSASGAARAC